MLVFGILPGVFQAAVAAVVILNSGSAYHHHADLLALKGPDDSARLAACKPCHLYSVSVDSAAPNLREDEPATPHSLYSIFGNISLLCLSCHDGAVAPTPPTSRDWLCGVSKPGQPPRDWSVESDIGHHPSGLEYPAGGKLFLLPLGDDPDCPLPLFSGSSGAPGSRMECATCHDVHSNGAESRLRVAKERFELCLCCHGQMPEINRHVYLPMQVKQRAIDKVECTACHDR